ncbi:MAG: hypothetical protein HZC37_00080 [Burkholderiales bacterium]|nr:hypothetical protein [Burkholderiales bacterium]
MHHSSLKSSPALHLLALLALGASMPLAPALSYAQAAAQPAAQAPAGPATADAEFWRSAERIGTVDALRAYLKAFPQGFYADLAKAAIDRLLAEGPRAPGGAPGAPGAPAAGASPRTAAAAGLPAAPSTTGLKIDPAQLLAGTPTSGAITMLPGETYYGPGPITVGYLGAKKQLVLPNGAWVLLAVADRQSGHSPAVPLVSMVFGQFREGQLISLMSYLFNGRSATLRNWPEVEDCHAEKMPRGSVREASVQRAARVCGWTVRSATAPKVVDAAWEQAQGVVVRLGALMPAPPLLYTRAWATDNNGNYLGIRRSDFIATAAIGGRATWLRDYLPWMLEGLDKKIGASELEPNQSRAPNLRLALPD